jgi:predicted FMN-binding regulatory protein PaiB
VGKFKLSQNRSTPDREGVEAGLQARDESALATSMQAARQAP